jgi:hypothetical protein
MERAFQHLFKADRYMKSLEHMIEPERITSLKIEYLGALRDIQISRKELLFAH